MPRHLALLCILAVLACATSLFGAADGQEQPKSGGIIDMPHLRDPELNVERSQRVLDGRLEPLWLSVLHRGDAAMKVSALQAFAEAHRAVGERFSDETRAVIVAHLDNTLPEDIRLAAAVTALELDERNAIAGMMELEQLTPSPYFTPTIDKALATWNHEPMRAIWRDRALDGSAPHEARRSAVVSLGVVADAEAADLLLDLAEDDEEQADLRLAAAKALGEYVSEGLATRAAALSQHDTTSALAAVAMLKAHSDNATLALLDQLTGHGDPTVAAAAARMLADKAPDRLNRALVDHPDPGARYAVTRAIVTAPESDSVVLLADRLDDPSVAVRKLARNTLIEWAGQSDLRSVIIEQIERVWSSAGWRGREQAALIVGWIDHKPMAEALSEALADDRPEVRLAVCSTLRMLEVPSTVPTIQQRLAAILAGPGDAAATLRASDVTDMDNEATQLVLVLGALEHRDAEPLYRKIIPKGSVPYSETRGAAIYVLGHWYEGVRDPELEAQLTGRMMDMSVLDPESVRVQQYCAIALGRMGAEDRLPQLQRTAFNNDAIGGPALQLAARWAIKLLTGEDLPLPPPPPSRMRGWFIEPVD